MFLLFAKKALYDQFCLQENNSSLADDMNVIQELIEPRSMAESWSKITESSSQQANIVTIEEIQLFLPYVLQAVPQLIWINEACWIYFMILCYQIV